MKVSIFLLLLTLSPGNDNYLRVGIAPYPPYVYVDSANQLKGFDIELIEYIAADQGKLVKFYTYTFQELFDAIQSDTIDMVAGCIYVTKEREKYMFFTRSYIQTGLVIVKRPDEDINSVSDLKNLRIAVKRRATGETWARNHARRYNLLVMPYDRLDIAYDDLKKGLVDALIDDHLHAVYMISQFSPGELEIVGNPLILQRFDVALGVNKKEPELLTEINSILLTFVGSPEYESMYRRWFFVSSPFYSQRKMLHIMFMLGMVFILLLLVITLMVQSRQRDMAIRLAFGIARATSRAIEVRNWRDQGHAERVAIYSEIIARRLDVFSNSLKIAALLHDFGNIALPDSIINEINAFKTGKDEIQKQHPVIGYLLLRGIKPLEKIANWIRWHHERWDGKGYPDGLKGKEIPIESRIIAVANAFDTMTTKSFRDMPALSVEDAKRELLRGAGTIWDPQVVAVAVDLLQKVEITSQDKQIFKMIDKIKLHSAEELKKLKVFYEILNIVRSTLNFEDMLKRILTLIKNSFDPNALYAIILPDEENNLYVAAQAGMEEISLVGMKIPEGKGITRKAFMEKRAIIVRDTEIDPLFVPPGDISIQSELAIPLIIGGHVLGVLDVESVEKNAFKTEDLDFLQAVATAVAVAIKVAKSFETEAKQEKVHSEIIPEEFPSIFKSLIEKARRENKPVSVVLLKVKNAHDIDLSLLPADSIVVRDGNLYTIVISNVDYDGAEEIMAQVLHDCGDCIYGIASFPADGSTANQVLAIAHYRLSFGGT